jgi:hypothetical protein
MSGNNRPDAKDDMDIWIKFIVEVFCVPPQECGTQVDNMKAELGILDTLFWQSEWGYMMLEFEEQATVLEPKTFVEFIDSKVDGGKIGNKSLENKLNKLRDHFFDSLGAQTLEYEECQ